MFNNVDIQISFMFLLFKETKIVLYEKHTNTRMGKVT